MEASPQWTSSTTNSWQFGGTMQSKTYPYYGEPQNLTKSYVDAESHKLQTPLYTNKQFEEDRILQTSYSEEIPCTFNPHQGLDLSSISKMNLIDYDYNFDNVQQQIASADTHEMYSNMPHQVLENLPENYCIDEGLPDLGNVDEWVDDSQSLPPQHSNNELPYEDGTQVSHFSHCDNNHEMPSMSTLVHNTNNYQSGPVDIAKLDDLTQRDMYLEMQKYPPSYQYKKNIRVYNSMEIPSQSEESLSVAVSSNGYDRMCRPDYQLECDENYFNKHFDPFECDRDTPPSSSYQESYTDTSPTRPINFTEDAESFTDMQTPTPRYRPHEEHVSGSQDDLPSHSPTRFKCKLCDIQFENQADLRRHKKEHKVKVKCPHCPSYLGDSATLKSHMRKHTGEKPWECLECGLRFPWKSNYCSHLRKHTGDKPYQCSKCDRKFRLLSTLKTHENIHEGRKPYACDQCDARFTQKSALRRHVLTHSDVLAYHCNLCDKKFRTQGNYKKHLNRHAQKAKTACEICGIGFPSAKKLETHKMTHNEGSHPYKCDSCSSQFQTLKSLTQHKKRLHTRHENIECKVCGMSFKQKSLLTSHMKEHNSFTCSTCNASFVNSKQLTSHQLSHKTKGPYECSVCGLYFHKKVQWKYHEECCESSMSPELSLPSVVPSEPQTYPSLRTSKNIVPPAKLLTEVLENFDRCEAYQNSATV